MYVNMEVIGYLHVVIAVLAGLANHLQLLQQGVNVWGGVEEQLPGLLDPGLHRAQVLLHPLPVPELLGGLRASGPGLDQDAEEATQEPTGMFRMKL